MASALITGIAGQDGSFLAELLLERGYDVSGVSRPGRRDLGPSEHLRERIELVEADLLDAEALRAALRRSRPDELYHLAAPSFVPDSWRHPADTMRAIVDATAVLLEEVVANAPATRVFVASSGAVFGAAPESPQHENTPPRPQNPYAIAKLAAQQLAAAVRETEGLHVSCGITYNHESERRPVHFVARRVTRGAAAIKLGLAEELTLGNLESIRDWSFAGDVVHGAWRMLQQPAGDDYILASGVGRSVRELAQTAFACLGLDAAEHIRSEPSLTRALDETPSVGDPTKARTALGWTPALDFEGLIGRMVEYDLAELSHARPAPEALAPRKQ